MQGKNVLIGVSGGIAVYKVCTLVRLFKKAGFGVDVVMTKNATEFVKPLTFETLSGRPVVTDMFNRTTEWEVEHISLAKKADVFVVCPATANVIAKMANGIADDMLTTTALATTCPTVVCPAMNTNMFNHPATQKNLEILKDRQVKIVESGEGFLACGDSGKGRMAEPQEIFDFVQNEIFFAKQDLQGKNVLITSGATAEKLDDVRFLTNFSSGKMGSALAEECLQRGAKVTMVLGRHTAKIPSGVEVVNVDTTEQMFDEVKARVSKNQLFVMAAAPCDYRPKEVASQKIKSQQVELQLVKNPDIAQFVGENKKNSVLVIFSAETHDELQNATQKLKKKNANFAVVNNVKDNIIFGSDTTVISIIDEKGVQSFDKMTKKEAAKVVIDKAVSCL